MNELTNLAVSLEQTVAKLPSAASDMAKAAAMTIIQDLALHTPVDVGTAVSNWQMSLDSPIETVIPAFSPSPRGKTIKGKWTNTVSPEITREGNVSVLISDATELLSTKKPGQDIYITNNLPYIEILDQGSSDQAPAGFVDRAQVLAQSVVDSGLNLG